MTAARPQDVEEKIRIVFQETLFGPETIDPDIDFAHDFPEECRPNLPKEMQYFRKFGDTYLTIDMLLSFTHFNRQGKFVSLTFLFRLHGGSDCSHHHPLPTCTGGLAAQTHPQSDHGRPLPPSCCWCGAGVAIIEKQTPEGKVSVRICKSPNHGGEYHIR